MEKPLNLRKTTRIYGWIGVGSVLLVVYGWVMGILGRVPSLPILDETIRMLYVHVPMWFGMVALLTASCYRAMGYLRSRGKASAYIKDAWSYAYAEVGFLMGILGLLTGMLWAKYTWGEVWSGDPKQNASALVLLLYGAYFMLRNSVKDEKRRASLSSLYNILGYGLMLPLIFVLPRLTDSLHPGSGGNPGFNTYDLNADMRWVFYPAVLGWIGVGIWCAHIRAKTLIIKGLDK